MTVGGAAVHQNNIKKDGLQNSGSETRTTARRTGERNAVIGQPRCENEKKETKNAVAWMPVAVNGVKKAVDERELATKSIATRWRPAA